MKTLNELLNAANNVKLPSSALTASSKGIMSFGIVNSEGNGKRFTMTKALINAIGVDKKVELLPIPDEGVLFVANKLPFDNAVKKELRANGEGRLAYAAPIVAFLIDSFNLDFGNHVSMTFQDITIDKLPDGSPVAIINMINPKPYAGNIADDDSVSDNELTA